MDALLTPRMIVGSLLVVVGSLALAALGWGGWPLVLGLIGLVALLSAPR